MTDRIRTEQLIDRLPAPRRSTASLVKTEFLGKKKISPEIPARQALAVAAFAQAHARGISRPWHIYDLEARSADSADDQLVVVRRCGPLNSCPPTDSSPFLPW